MSKRIVITGSTGFVGSHWVAHFLKNTDWEIVGLDSFRHRGDALRVHPYDSKRYRIFTCDLSTPISDRMQDLIGPVDYIANLASESHVERSIQDPVPFVQNNFNIALSMLEYARKAKPKAFLQISTDEVYGAAPKGMDHAEWCPVLPSNPYAASKAGQEALAIAYWRTYGVPLIITNTMNMMGQMQDAEKFIPLVISKIIKGEKIQIHGNAQTIGSRFYLHARNHADAHLFLLDHHQPTEYVDSEIPKVIYPSRFNVVGEVEMNNLEVAKLIAKFLGKELDYELVDFHAARPGHDRRYALDGKKLNEAGWKMPVHFEQTLQETVEWYVNHPEWLK